MDDNSELYIFRATRLIYTECLENSVVLSPQPVKGTERNLYLLILYLSNCQIPYLLIRKGIIIP